MQKITVTVSVRISVTGDVSQIPSIPHIVGKTKIVMSRIKIPRRKAITADCFGQLMEEEGRKGTDEQDMEAIITEGKERQEHE